MKMFLIVVAAFTSAMLVVPTVSQAQTNATSATPIGST